jgi:hypothetical protein
MASLAALAIRIFTTVLDGILIASPVAGLRPIRDLGFNETSFPVPGRVKAGFLFWKVGSRMSVARTIYTVFWENSNFFYEPN